MQPKSLDELFASCQRSAVHLEMRDSYGVEHESQALQQWLKTGTRDNLDPDGDYWRPWATTVRDAVARGVVVRRARIVSTPVSPYIAYEHAGTVVNLAIGELVRWLPREKAFDLAVPVNDCWVFDDATVRFGLFAGNGALVRHEVTTDTAVAKLCSDAFEAVWDRATPHEDFPID
ncbi:hypothetical protein ABH931_001951 [Streptacidiphilus sp. MAP12-33]|uniref:DUF6879 family protein n=1 Tax=Streptacidiphilus sp. MAP12-33 TaxID=3156266 RepID=UPI0035146257